MNGKLPVRDDALVFDAIGTRWQIDIDDPLTSTQRERLLNRVRERIAVFDKDYSRFREDSLVTAMSRHAGTYRLPEDAEPMFTLYQDLYRRTDGALTPLIGSVMEEAGYDARYSLIPKELHTPPAWDDVLDYHAPELTLKQPALLDVGAAGKGHLIDIIGTEITRFGIGSFCIDAGGDLLHHSAKGDPLRIGLEHPDDPQQVIGVATISNASLCGSAGNRRTWDRFHHIIDPRTLTSPREIVATWTTATDALIADALATSLFFVPAERLTDGYDFEYLVLHKDFSVTHSPAFPAELFTA